METRIVEVKQTKAERSAALQAALKRVKGKTLEYPVVRDPRVPPAGTVLVRKYNGIVHRVTCLGAKGFEYRGGLFSSLSTIGVCITGSESNGYRFFGLDRG